MKEKALVRCFADRSGKCSVLTIGKCNRIKCSFFKTKEQYNQGRQEASKHIRSLDRATQMNIIGTYYGGKMSELLDE